MIVECILVPFATMERMEEVMQGIMKSQAQGLTVEVLTAMIAGAAVLGLGCIVISRRKVCGRGIFIFYPGG